MDTQIQAYKDIITQLNVLKPLMLETGAVEESKLEALLQNLGAKIEDFHPKLMVYGIYNAGKSTLINALLGKEEARMGETPETSKIETYAYGDYELYDTPGLNAPIEHEQITQAHYKKCELIVFVLSNDKVDEAFAYEKIKQIVDDGKPVIIALNNKQGYGDDEMRRLEDHIYENLKNQNIAHDKSFVYAINAKSALKGRLENKQQLLEKSGFPILRAKIDDLLQKSGIKEVVHNCNNNINEFILAARTSIEKLTNNEALKILENFITRMHETKRAKNLELDSMITAQMSSLYEQIVSSLINGGSAQSLIDGFVSKIQGEMSEYFAVIAKDVKADIENVRLSIEKIDTDMKVSLETIKVDSVDYDTITKSLAALVALIPHPAAKVAAGILASIGGLICSLFGESGSGASEHAQIHKAKNCADTIIISLRKAINKTKESAINSIFDPIIEAKMIDKQKQEENERLLLHLSQELGSIQNKLPAL